MTSEEIRKIREDLGITQDEFARLIDVTKASVARYESGQANPSEGTLKRLLFLQGSLIKPEEREILRNICRNDGGTGVLAGLLTFAAAMIPLATLSIVGVTLFNLFKGPARKMFFDTIEQFPEEKPTRSLIQEDKQ